MKKTTVLLAVLLAFLPGVLGAQAILAFVDDDTQVTVTDSKGNPVIVNEGMVLPVGGVVKTLKTSVEIQLKPTGTIIKLATSTTFKVQQLKETDGLGSNDFVILQGKIRTIAAKLEGGTAPGYNFATPLANCGVRGTDFALEYDPANQNDRVFVQSGRVEFTDISTGSTVPVGPNQQANTFAGTFQPTAVDPAKLGEFFADLDFVRLDPKSVATGDIEPQTVLEAPAPGLVEAPAPAPRPQALEPATKAPGYPGKLFGIEAGSVTIHGLTYSKAILTPVFTADNFKLGLYLPVIYNTNIMDPGTWYRPAGNNEWSFGTDQSGLQNQWSDFAADLFLKVKYLEWGTQGTDQAYLKVGNLDDMTLGHGTVVENLSNDQDFPAVRKIGLNAGARFGAFSAETLADDLTNPSVVGGRLAVDVIPAQLSFGLQTTADFHLADQAALAPLRLDPADFGDPILLVGGFDAQFFKVDLSPVFTTMAFADLNSLAVYYNRTPVFAPTLASGLDTATLWHDGGPGSWGGETGLSGSVSQVTYRVAVLIEKGVYANQIFSGDYYRTRGNRLGSVFAYDTDPGLRTQLENGLTLGLDGSAGFTLFGTVNLGVAYKYPVHLNSDGTITYLDTDDFRLSLNIPKDKAPLIRLSGGIAYDRTDFAPSLRNGTDLFDVNTVVSGHVDYGIAEGLDLSLTVSTATVLDSNGHFVYDPADKPKMAPTISLDTKVSL